MSKPSSPLRDADDGRIAAELAAIADSLRSRQLQVTAALYQADDRGRPVMVGSSVLLSLAGARFLVTAGHVLDRHRRGALVAGVSPDLLTVWGDVTRLYATSATTREGDSVDLGIVRLEGEPWCDLPSSCFLSWAEIDHHVPIMSSHTFGLVGYPLTKNRHGVSGNRMTSVAYGVAGLECTAEQYQATQTNPQIHLMIGFDKRTMWAAGGQRTAPDLYGVSGGGLWRYGRRIRDATAPPALSAIVVEWHRRGRHKYLLGTRIHVVISALLEKYADLRIR